MCLTPLHAGAGFFGTVAAGGISAAGGNMVTQYQKTGTIDSREVATATAGGMLGAGIGYGITKCISYAAGRIGNTGSNGGTCPAEGTASYAEGENETNNYGRSVSPTFVEDVIQNGSRALQENGNISYSSGTVEVITNIRGDVVTIMTK